MKIVPGTVHVPFHQGRNPKMRKNPDVIILSIFSSLLLDNKDINIFEDGKESRDFIHVKDVASAVIKSINTAASNGEIINLGSGIGTSVIEIAETLKRIYGSTSNLNVTGDFRIGDIAHNVADTQKARKLLDFTPSISLQEGLTEFCEWVLGQETDNSRYEQSLTEMERSGMFIRK
ncbi:nucleotide sugar epimerase [Bifidobacterium longum]|nr:nucleotide sugar epimerase [Bifidobacterium longum]